MNITTQVQGQMKAYKEAAAIPQIDSVIGTRLDTNSQSSSSFFEDKQKSFAQILKKKLDQSESK